MSGKSQRIPKDRKIWLLPILSWRSFQFKVEYVKKWPGIFQFSVWELSCNHKKIEGLKSTQSTLAILLLFFEVTPLNCLLFHFSSSSESQKRSRSFLQSVSLNKSCIRDQTTVSINQSRISRGSSKRFATSFYSSTIFYYWLINMCNR